MKKSKNQHEKMCQEIIRYLESLGGKVLVIGGIRVRQRTLKYNFTFEIDFTGKWQEEIKKDNEEDL